MRWECRYSPSVMLYLDVGSECVRTFLHHSEAAADRWSFADVLGGTHDAEVQALFGDAVLAELKAEVRRRVRT